MAGAVSAAGGSCQTIAACTEVKVAAPSEARAIRERTDERVRWRMMHGSSSLRPEIRRFEAGNRTTPMLMGVR